MENWLEAAGLVSGVFCVWLLIKEHILTFPLVRCAVVTVIVVARALLYADVLLNLYYVLMNAYGWYYWLYGGQQLREEAGELLPQRITVNTVAALVPITAFGTVPMGYR